MSYIPCNRETKDTNIDSYRKLYNSSDTFPEFFVKLNRNIDKQNRCRFFKTWLYYFISSQILIEHTWYIDLFPKIEIVSSFIKPSIKNKM